MCVWVILYKQDFKWQGSGCELYYTIIECIVAEYSHSIKPGFWMRKEWNGILQISTRGYEYDILRQCTLMHSYLYRTPLWTYCYKMIFLCKLHLFLLHFSVFLPFSLNEHDHHVDGITRFFKSDHQRIISLGCLCVYHPYMDWDISLVASYNMNCFLFISFVTLSIPDELTFFIRTSTHTICKLHVQGYGKAIIVLYYHLNCFFLNVTEGPRWKDNMVQYLSIWIQIAFWHIQLEILLGDHFLPFAQL